MHETTFFPNNLWIMIEIESAQRLKSAHQFKSKVWPSKLDHLFLLNCGYFFYLNACAIHNPKTWILNKISDLDFWCELCP